MKWIAIASYTPNASPISRAHAECSSRHCKAAVSPVPQHNPPLCCRIEEDNPTSTACQALTQVTHGMAIIQPNHLGSPILWQGPCTSGWTREDESISLACIALSQVTLGTGFIHSNLICLPSPKPQSNTQLGSGMEAITPASPTTPALSPSNKDRMLSSVSAKENKGQSLHKPHRYLHKHIQNGSLCSPSLGKHSLST